MITAEDCQRITAMAHRGSAAEWFGQQQAALDRLRSVALCDRCAGEGVLMVPDGDESESAHEEQCRCWWGWLLSPAATTPLNPPGDEEPF